jgi:hypothetical protein
MLFFAEDQENWPHGLGLIINLYQLQHVTTIQIQDFAVPLFPGQY